MSSSADRSSLALLDGNGSARIEARVTSMEQTLRVHDPEGHNEAVLGGVGREVGLVLGQFEGLDTLHLSADDFRAEMLLRDGNVRFDALESLRPEPVEHVAVVKTVPATPAEPAEPVPDLSAESMRALNGRLSTDDVQLLGELLTTRRDLRTRDLASRVLMANSWARGDRTSWEILASRHLDRVNQDADVALKLSIVLAQQDGRDDDVIARSEMALAHAGRWTGRRYTRRVASLLKLRARAALQLWDRASEPPSLPWAAEPQRERAATYATEWLDFVRDNELDDEVPLLACQLVDPDCG